MTEYSRYQLLLSLFNSAFMVATFVFAWWRTRTATSDQRFTDINKRFSDIDARLVDQDKTIAAIKASRGECASHARMEETDKQINARLDGISSLLSKIDGRLEGINRMVDLLTQNELSGGKKE